MLIPPVNWGLVERGLSRSGLPTIINFPFMDKQKIKTIIYLAAEEEEETTTLEPAMSDLTEDRDLSFIADNQINLIQLGGVGGKEPLISDAANPAVTSGAGKVAAATKDTREIKQTQSNWKPTSEDLVIAALNLILDPRMYPLHVMCSSSGRHRTGVVIGCFRKLQRWALSAIFAEYRRYAGSSRGATDANNELMMNEQFIELFDVDLVSNTLAQRHIQKHLKQLNVNAASLAGSSSSKDGDLKEVGGLAGSSSSSATLLSAKKTSSSQLNIGQINKPPPTPATSRNPTSVPSTPVPASVSHAVDFPTPATSAPPAPGPVLK